MDREELQALLFLKGRLSGLSREIKKTWAVLVGGYIFSHKIRLRPRLLKQFIPKKVIEKNLLYYHKVICQDVFKRPKVIGAERAKRKILEIGSKGYHKEALKEVYITTKSVRSHSKMQQRLRSSQKGLNLS